MRAETVTIEMAYSQSATTKLNCTGASRRFWAMENDAHRMSDSGTARQQRPCSRNGPEVVARNVREWLGRIGVKTLVVELAARGRTATARASSPSWRDELLAAEQFSTLHEAKVLIERWRRHYNVGYLSLMEFEQRARLA